ncbi:MAG: CARDB domain-containing protein [Candidatus Poseidoniaceae archaeon]
MEHNGCQFPASVLVGMLLCTLLAFPAVHAEDPVDLQFVGANSLTYSGADEFAVLTNNATVRQGDYLLLEIPVENVGSSTQVASIAVDVRQTEWNETVYFESVSIDAMVTEVLVYFSSHQVFEGQLNVEISINNTSLSLNDSIEIGPPPLPNVQLDIQPSTSEYASGDLIQFNLTSTNALGERAFDGTLVCNFLNDEVYNQSLNVDVGQTIVNTVGIYARPGILECIYGGDRNQSVPTNVEFSLEGLPSAVFNEAGSSGFSFIDGPWHVGDKLETSFILRNQGDATGSATLRVLHDGMEFFSESLTLDAGSAGEIALDFSDLSEGLHTFEWSIVSTNGLVASGLEGVASLTVLAPQDMFAELEVNDGSSGIVLDWNVSITDGVDRDVKLRFGYRVSGTDVFVNEQTVTLGSGTVTGQTTLGDIQGNTVVLRMEPSGWVSSTNSYIATASFVTSEAGYSLQIDPITLPREPIQGEDVTVTVMLQNTGSVEGPAGELYLTDSSGLLLGQVSTDPLQASSSRNIDFTFVVPDDNELLLKAEWRYETSIVEGEQSILVTAKVVEEASVEIPFVAIGGGIAVACCIILVLHLRRGASLDKPKSEKVSKKKATTSQPKKKEAEPVERSCPACDRTLRIPGDYSGTVRCPDCSEKFEVEAEHMPELDEELDAIDDAVEEEQPVEKKIEIACTQCSSKLRVPSNYRGSVRCPSCSNVFSAA